MNMWIDFFSMSMGLIVGAMLGFLGGLALMIMLDNDRLHRELFKAKTKLENKNN
jgi:hypothetical protein